MNSETLFSMALGLQSPWQVKEVTFSTDESARSELLQVALLIGLLFTTGIVGFISGEFIVSTVLFAGAAIFSNIISCPS
jgi:hypothetical protein